MKPFEQVKAFLRQRGSPGIRTMPDPYMDEWLWHHDRQQTLGVIEQPDGTVTGVGVAVRYHGEDGEPQGGMWAINREGGDRVWVIEVAAVDDDALMKCAGSWPVGSRDGPRLVSRASGCAKAARSAKCPGRRGSICRG